MSVTVIVAVTEPLTPELFQLSFHGAAVAFSTAVRPVGSASVARTLLTPLLSEASGTMVTVPRPGPIATSPSTGAVLSSVIVFVTVLTWPALSVARSVNGVRPS